MTLLRPFLVLLALVLPALAIEAAPAPVQESQTAQESLWETLVLPAGFLLDLRSGVVVSRPRGESASLRFSGGRLTSANPLRLLPSGATAGGTRFSRDAGEAIPGVTPQVGQELIFDCFGGVWGLVRILEVSPQSLTLEFVLEVDPGKRELRRIPAELHADSGPEGVHLRWPSQPGELHRVERRRIASGIGESHGAWEEVTRISGGEFTDELVSLGRLTEYRVVLVSGETCMGSIARGVPGIEPPQVRAQVGPGTELNLFSAIDDSLRVDLIVETIRPNGVQVLPGVGVFGRQLTPDQRKHWQLDEVSSEGYRKQRYFLQQGQVLALRLPEGIHCLLRVEEIRDQSVLFSRQFDLVGDRLFPPVPAMPETEWKPGRGVIFRFPPAPREVPVSGAFLVVERERVLDSDDWQRCVVGEPGQLELIDDSAVSELLVRYRFRQGTDLERLSLTGDSITVLVGGESDAARTILLERAILDLGSEDFERRERARAVLVALGEGAWPLLREALRSDNPEQAASARELLVEGLREAGAEQEIIRGGFARLLLSIRAEELGLDGPPHADWTTRSAGQRALACLRGLGWRESAPAEISGWRRVLAEKDPDDAVRLAAGLAQSLEAEGYGPDLGFSFAHGASRSSASASASDLWPFGEPGLERELQRDPWTTIVRAQARHALDIARHGTREQQDLAESDLALAGSLTAHFLRKQDDLFLDCGLRLIEDPQARLRGALEMADRRREARRVASAAVRRTVRLEAPRIELLDAELALLEGGGEGPVEILLPAGVYGPLPEGGTLTVAGADFVLRAEGEVELNVGLTLLKGCRVALHGLRITPRRGIAINVVHSELLLEDCHVEGGTLALLGTDALVEVEDSTLLAPPVAGPGGAGMRFGGRSLLIAEGSRIECPGVAISGARAMLLERCVVISTQRNAIEGGTGSDLWALACLIEAEKSPYLRLTRGVLEGVALVGDLGSSLSGNWGVRVCSEHLRCDAEQADFRPELWLESCSLGR